MDAAPSRNADGTRHGFGSLTRQGLHWEALPLRLFSQGMAKAWNADDIDCSQDAADWAALSDDERFWASLLCAQFAAGEEAVTEDIQPFLAAMATEGRLEDELYLAQFVMEEARHTYAFRRWMDAVGLQEDLHHLLEDNPGYRRIFYEELPRALQRLHTDPSPEAQVRASVTYNHLVEGTLALTGYYAWNLVCQQRGILPGMQEIIRRIGDDERRHMAWGTFTCRRHVAADPAMTEVVQDQMESLLPAALENVQHPFRAHADRGMPFGIDEDMLVAYATDRGMRRLDAINKAAGKDREAIDEDTTGLDLEERFAEEDRATVAEASG